MNAQAGLLTNESLITGFQLEKIYLEITPNILINFLQIIKDIKKLNDTKLHFKEINLFANFINGMLELELVVNDVRGSC